MSCRQRLRTSIPPVTLYNYNITTIKGCIPILTRGSPSLLSFGPATAEGPAPEEYAARKTRNLTIGYERCTFLAYRHWIETTIHEIQRTVELIIHSHR